MFESGSDCVCSFLPQFSSPSRQIQLAGNRVSCPSSRRTSCTCHSTGSKPGSEQGSPHPWWSCQRTWSGVGFQLCDSFRLGIESGNLSCITSWSFMIKLVRKLGIHYINSRTTDIVVVCVWGERYPKRRKQPEESMKTSHNHWQQKFPTPAIMERVPRADQLW